MRKVLIQFFHADYIYIKYVKIFHHAKILIYAVVCFGVRWCLIIHWPQWFSYSTKDSRSTLSVCQNSMKGWRCALTHAMCTDSHIPGSCLLNMEQMVKAYCVCMCATSDLKDVKKAQIPPPTIYVHVSTHRHNATLEIYLLMYTILPKHTYIVYMYLHVVLVYLLVLFMFCSTLTCVHILFSVIVHEWTLIISWSQVTYVWRMCEHWWEIQWSRGGIWAGHHHWQPEHHSLDCERWLNWLNLSCVCVWMDVYVVGCCEPSRYSKCVIAYFCVIP